MSKVIEVLKVKDVPPSKVRRGHQDHRSGAGVHAHKATKRNRTRSDQRRQALEE